MEEASGLPASRQADWTGGLSIGTAAATAFANDFKARDVLYTTTATILAMFSKDPESMLHGNLLLDARDKAELSAYVPRSIYMTGISLAQKFLGADAVGRYDAAILSRVLERRFGNRRLKDSPVSVFAIACGVNGRERAVIFGHKNEALFPGAPDMPLHFPDLNKHEDMHVRTAIELASGFVGFLGYGVHGEKIYMDAGSNAQVILHHLMDDLHDLALPGPLAAPKKRFAGLLRGASHPALVSRLVYFGVGDESHLPFAGNIKGGVASNGGPIVRYTGELNAELAFTGIRKRFETASRTHTGLPCVQVLDKYFEAGSTYQAFDLRDGRPETILKQVDFSRDLIIERRHEMIDEINLRMRTLQARGAASAEEVKKTAARMERYRDAQEAVKLYDSFALKAADLPRILEENGFADPVASALSPQPAKSGWRLPLIGGSAAPAPQPAG